MLHDKAVSAAMNAAFAVSQSETWMFGLAEGEPTVKARRAWTKKREEWLAFARDNRMAPVEALWIRAGALGFHDGKTQFFALSPMLQLAFQTFLRVLCDISDAMDRIERDEAARIEAEKRAEEAAARAKQPADLEGTPMEPLDDPMAPSAFARPPATQPEGEGA